MDKYLDKEIYKKAKRKADATYERHSAYKSMFLSKTYKEMGGRYKTSKKDSKLKNWRDEEWIQVLPYLIDGIKVPCGAGNNKKGCRPLKRINKDTPTTLGELIKKFGKKKLVSLAKLKRKNMNIRINWEEAKQY
jgi:hypothetical protein